MDAILARSFALLLLSALTALAADVGPTRVPVPKHFTLKKTSYNFNSTLSWDYDKTAITPRFQVEYRNGNWTVVETCWNISRNYCDLSEKIVDPYENYMFRVKAFAGSEMIGYEKAEFYLIDDGIIGPPTLNASANGKFIDVDIWYPDAPHIDGKNNVGDYLEELTYYLHYGSKTMEMDECDLLGCSVRILITNQTRYCFSAEGKLDQVPMTMEKSEEICINITATKGPPNRSTAIYISLLVVAIFIILIFVVIIKRKMDHKPGLPSPLINIAKNKRSPMHLVSEQGTKYERCSIESPKEQMTPEEADMDLKGSGIQESTDPKYQGSLGESEQMANEDQNVNEESSDSKNYYHTENSNSTTVCLTEDDDANKQEPVRDLKPVTNSYGYDKPHCPL